MAGLQPAKSAIVNIGESPITGPMSALAGYDLFKKELLPAPHLTLTKYVFSGSFVKSIVSSGLAPIIGEDTLFNGRQLFMLLIWAGVTMS